jgi:hypothetical protein
LISRSALLSASEKQQWLEMLGLMNDKQMIDLIAILQPPKTVARTPVLPVGSSELAGQTPRLPHITNLPLGIGLQPSARPVLAAKPTRSISGLVLPKLKEIFAEKELPPPKPQPALADHTEGEPTPIQPPSPQIGNLGLRYVPPQPPAAQPSFSPATEPAPATPPLPPAASAPVPPKGPEPTAAGRAEAVSVAPRSDQAPAPPRFFREVKVDSLQDVANLSLNAFRATGVERLAKELTKLVKKHGYFEVLVNLEQSQLYKKYLDIGQASLTNNLTFAQLLAVQTPRLEVQMTKEEFESVADLLQRLQTNS